MKEIFSTDTVPESKRLRYWEEVLSKNFMNFEIDLDQGSVDDFFCTVAKESTGNLEIFEISTKMPHRAQHSGGRSEDMQNAAIVIALQMEGKGSIFQDGRHDVIMPGELTLFDATRDFELNFDGPMRQIVLLIPWRTVQTQLISPRRITGMGIGGNTGVGGVASEFINAFAQQASSMETSECNSLTRSLIDIINAAVVSRLSQASLSKSDYVQFQMHAARMYIEDNLRDPNLSPTIIAESLRVSPRYINKLFEAENLSLNRLIWERRLENCRQDLQNPRMDGKSITEIAHSWGFKSSSHFSRTFKEAYKMNPREIRATRG